MLFVFLPLFHRISYLTNLPIQGVTSYRALKYSDTHIGDWIVIPGAGGGLGHLAVQYAAAMGLRVVAIDTGEEKRKLVEKLGAEKWIDFKTTKGMPTSTL